jgi:hypothetical protein
MPVRSHSVHVRRIAVGTPGSAPRADTYDGSARSWRGRCFLSTARLTTIVRHPAIVAAASRGGFGFPPFQSPPGLLTRVLLKEVSCDNAE